MQQPKVFYACGVCLAVKVAASRQLQLPSSPT